MSILVMKRMIDLLVLLFSFGAVTFMIQRSQKGNPPKIRPLAALDAMDEFVGRAVEMGQPILCSPGWGRSFTETESTPQFMAFLSVLDYVSRKAYESGAEVMVSVAVPEMLPLSQQILADNAKFVGNIELFDETKARYYPGSTGLITATMGLFSSKDRPASFLLLGPLFMEGLYLAHLASQSDVFSIGGTAALGQLVFLVVCFDYVLIGEEIYAAGAYLSNEPLQLGSIGGQDIIKILAIVAGVVGFILCQFI